MSYMSLTLILFLIWIAIFIYKFVQHRRNKSRHPALSHTPQPTSAFTGDGLNIIIGYASQSGFTESLAWKTAGQLVQAGFAVNLDALNDITATDLVEADLAIFLASTTGEGDAPRNARRFKKTIMRSKVNLTNLKYSIVCFGDKTYENYCGFGIDLCHWLKKTNAIPLHTPVLVDNADDYSVGQWKKLLKEIFPKLNTVIDNDDSESYTRWRLEERITLNPESPHEKLYRLKLSSAEPFAVSWNPCDIALIHPCSFKDLITGQSTLKPREYTISSSIQDGTIDLFVRLMSNESRYGVCSHFLTKEAKINDTIALKVQRNPILKNIETTAPAILVGAGSGVAGVIGQVKNRLNHKSYRTWVIYGERCPNGDRFISDPFRSWHNHKQIEKFDIIFSKDTKQEKYVHDLLLRNTDDLLSWLNSGAYIYICGSHEKLGKSMESTLISILGQSKTEQMIDTSRILFDTY